MENKEKQKQVLTAFTDGIIEFAKQANLSEEQLKSVSETIMTKLDEASKQDSK